MNLELSSEEPCDVIVQLPASQDFHMTSRFPGPWRIAEFPNGFAVYDSTGRQLGFFYGRADPNMAGHASFLMIDDARQIAIDFARLPELLNQNLARSEIVTSTEGDQLAKLETNHSLQGVPEASRLPRAAQLSVITATASPSLNASTTIRRSIALEPDRRRSPQMLRRPGDPRFIRMKFLIPIAAIALPASYLFFGDSDPPVNVGVVPQVTTNRLSVEFAPLREAKAPLSEAPGSTIDNSIEPKLQTTLLQPTENGIEVKPPQTLPEEEARSLMSSPDASTCFPSASAVRQKYPEERPSWTLRAPGHEGTRCWYPAKRR